MTAAKRSTTERFNESGVSIIIIAVSLVFVLGIAGLGLDLASLYVGRSQAQRAADAAALAGAQAFVAGGCATGSTGTSANWGYCTAIATQRAESVGNRNLIQGASPAIKDSDISFPDTSGTDPQIRVVAGRGTYDGLDHGNAMPTFFMKIFGVMTASVSATATAEAFNPSGTQQTIGATCLKPWIFPNCDQFNPDTNSDCKNGAGYFINTDGKVARPVDYPEGALGEPFLIKPGNPSGTASPGQFYAAYLSTTGAIPTDCPSCASTVTTGGTGSGALYRANIECCNANPIYCGETLDLETTLQSTPGDMVGPTYEGVNCLIHEDQIDGTATCGQDYVQGLTDNCKDPPPAQGAAGLPALPQIPPLIMPGANNPLDPNGTSPISNSDSVITAPIYNGVIQPGQNTIHVAGFLQLFLRDTSQAQQGSTYAYVLNISSCGGGGSPNPGGPVTASYGTSIPVRLISQ
ncbi:MAG: pilus assembly protein TadG-related protein [Acidobacteriota bacterium]